MVKATEVFTQNTRIDAQTTGDLTRKKGHLCSDVVVHTLECLGFRAAFGIPGGAIATIFNSLLHSKVITTICCQHEGAAAYMAMGRTLCSRGKELGLCFSTAGPGVTNLITGVAAAFEERVPIFVVSGNISTTRINKGAAQDAFESGINAIRMLESVTAISTTIFDKTQIVPLMIDLFKEAKKKRRPVHLNIPINVASDSMESSGQALIPELPIFKSDFSAIETASRVFLASERPLIFAGNGIKTSGYEMSLRALVDTMHLPVVVTSHAKGIIPEDHPMYFGCFGFAANERAKTFIAAYKPTAILFLGTRLGEVASASWSDLLLDPEIRIHVDMDEAQFNRVYPVTHEVRADLNDFMNGLLCFHDSLNQNEIDAAAARLSKKAALADAHVANMSIRKIDTAPKMHGPADPVDLVKVLDFWLPENVVIFSDIGSTMAWLINNLTIRAGQEFFLPTGLGAMGSGLCSAIGSKSGIPDRPVVCFVGDCAALMHGTELFTATNANIAIKVFVFNDGGPSMVNHGLKLLGLDTKDIRFPKPVDFVSFAKSLNVTSYKASNLAEFVRLPLDLIFASPEPVLVDVLVDGTAVPPILERIKAFSESRNPQPGGVGSA